MNTTCMNGKNKDIIAEYWKHLMKEYIKKGNTQ